jgi:hypothetical protein
MRFRRSSQNRITAVGVLALSLLALGLLGTVSACAPSTTAPVPLPSASSGSSASPGGPKLVPDGNAKENLPFFDATNEALLVTTPKPDGRAFIDSLVAAGFTKSDMEVTPDKTAIGLDRDNIQFSVKFGKACVIGQFGNVGYHSTIAPVTQTGSCLIGLTRAIDW